MQKLGGSRVNSKAESCPVEQQMAKGCILEDVVWGFKSVSFGDG